ncbi:MAG TPA: dipeptidase [Candidatus Cybelea sp.]|nr:dipeptidase [Candidatus Cybelea sp.]
MKSITEILRESPLIDGHNDLPWQFRKLSQEGVDGIELADDTTQLAPPVATDLKRLKAGGVGGQFWAVYVPASMRGAEAVAALLEQIDCVHRFVARYPDTLELALTAEDVVRIHGEGKIASLIGLEGGHAINNSLAVLRMAHALGARYLTLTHVKNNDWADAGTDQPLHHGLTPLGEEVVREMNRLGMMVDLSHVSDETMLAALKISRAPVICSHSGARALCRHARNVPDDLLKLIAASGGVVMAAFLPAYLTEADRLDDESANHEMKRLTALHAGDASRIASEFALWRKTHPEPHEAALRHVADHIVHIRVVAGIDHVGIGSDFDGFKNPPKGLEDVSCFPALLAELRQRGFSESDLKKVAGENLLRVMRAVARMA